MPCDIRLGCCRLNARISVQLAKSGLVELLHTMLYSQSGRLITRALCLLSSIALISSQYKVHADPITKDDPCQALITCTEPLTSERSTFYFNPSYQAKTAFALYEKGYYAEAINWFETTSSPERQTWYDRKISAPIVISCFPQFTLAKAACYEKLGNEEKALDTLACGQAPECALPHIRLLLKLGKCQEAGRLCDIRLEQLRHSNTNSIFKNETGKLEFLKNKAKSQTPYASEEELVETADPKLSKQNKQNKQKKIDSISKRIEKTKNTNPSQEPDRTLANLYKLRASYRWELGQLELALADSKKGYVHDDIGNMDFEAKLLIALGKYTECIDLINKMPFEKMQQRDLNYWNLYLAKAYLLNNQYKSALTQANKVIESESQMDVEKYSKMKPRLGAIDRMTAPALTIRALAEFQMGEIEEARNDAKRAEVEFLEISRVDCRDHVKKWRTEILK